MSGLWNFKLSRKAMAPFFPRVLSKSSKCPWEREVLADRVLGGLRHERLGRRGEPGASGGQDRRAGASPRGSHGLPKSQGSTRSRRGQG